LERLKRIVSPLNGAAAWGLTAANSLLHSSVLTKYAPLVNARFPEYYYSRTSNPFRYSGNGLGSLYSSDFVASIDRERSLEPVRRLQAHVQGQNPLNAMLYIDTKSWLPDDLLIKADKMSMANSLELRVPLLDHKVLEFAASLPPHLKVHGFTTKYLAKKALGSRIPRPILNRPKVGFPVPYEKWLSKELNAFTEAVLTDRKTRERGYFDRRAIGRILNASRSPGMYAKELFSLLTLEFWHRMFVDVERPAHYRYDNSSPTTCR